MRGAALRRGQSTMEFVLVSAGVFFPVTLALVFTAQLLWVWVSVVEMTREGARYAATHCWQSDAQNVISYIRTHVPLNIDQEQFTNGEAEIVVEYFARDPESGALVEFACDGDCSTSCIPDAVVVRVRNYEFRHFMSYLGLPPVTIPGFQTTLPMESAGCDPEQGTCLP
jgi:hypothetical protein